MIGNHMRERERFGDENRINIIYIYIYIYII